MSFFIGVFCGVLGTLLFLVGLLVAWGIAWENSAEGKKDREMLERCKAACQALELEPESPAPRFDPLPAEEPYRPPGGPCVLFAQGAYSWVWGRFHLDESASDEELAELLRLYDLDVTTTKDACLQHAKDSTQLAWAARERRVLICFDRDFLSLHNQGVQHAGILHSPQGKVWYQEILRCCLRLSEEVAQA